MGRRTDIVVPRPKEAPSGLLRAAAVVPEAPVGGALRLRRAVALTVVLGTVSLLAYASWLRGAHARQPAAPAVQASSVTAAAE
jgi:hypothetical protein